MASSREVEIMLRVLNSPEHEGRPTEEVVAAAIEALDDHRARSRRLAVVGQIAFGPQEATHTVVLGPFSARGYLDTEEKFRKAVEGGSAARTAGQDLACDPATKRGRGRFMLAPAFAKPRDAWDFFRPPKGELASGPWNLGLPEEILQRIRDDVARWKPGIWDSESPPGSAATCRCGLPPERPCTRCGAMTTRHCPRHEPGAEAHQCRREAA